MLLLALAACSHPPVEAPPAAPPSSPPPEEAPPAFAETDPPSPRLAGPLPEPGATSTRAWLTTDKPLYRPGDTVWVASWQVDAALAGAKGEGITYTLLGPRGDVVVEKFVRQQDGAATNDLVVPPSAAGGTWTVRATAADGTTAERDVVVLGFEAPRMKKTLEFLRKGYAPGDTVAATLTVKGLDGAALTDRSLTARVRLGAEDLPPMTLTTNAAGEALVRFPLPAGLTDADALLTVSVQDSGITEAISRRIPVTLDDVTVGVFPEGGALVEGLPSRVYFAARKGDGKPADVSGEVVDDRGETVATFRSFHHGLGRFALTPRAGRRYALVVQGRRFELPAAKTEGCVLTTVDDFASKLGVLRAQVRCSSAREVAVVASVRGKPLDGARVRVPRRDAATVYLEDGGAPGAARVTVTGEDGAPLAERAVFRNRDQQLTITLTPDRATYGPRDEVALDVAVTDPAGAPVQATVALAVVDDAVLAYADDKQGDIVSGLLLEAEVPGEVEEPRSFFAEPTGYALDLLLGTAGWRTFEAAPPPSEEPPPASLARKEEGRVGRKDAGMDEARGDRVQLERALDEEVAQNAGVLGALAMNGDVGVKGLGGLGARGMGVGGGGLGAFGTGGFGARTSVGEAIVLGSLDKGLIDAVIKRHLNQVRYCYERALQRQPDLSGKLVVKFVIAADGRVSSASPKADTLADPAVGRCVTQRFLRFRFPASDGGGIVIVSYPFVFSPDGLPAAPTYAAVRTFPTPRHAAGGPRTDFRDTVAWLPALRTDAQGRATARFTLSDAVTSFRATAQGLGGGRVGRGDIVLASSLPFSMAVKLPVAAVAGDTLHVPLTLTNTRDTTLDVTVASSLGAPRTVALPPRGGATLLYDVAADRTVPVDFTAEADGLTDAYSRTLRVLDAGYPQSWSASGRLDGPVTHSVAVDDVVGRAPTAWVKVYADLLPTVTDALEGLLAEPHGCFEQASSANYPNLMVLRLLERGSPDAALATRTRGLLEAGYQRLTSYETRGGGYEWFGGFPAHGALTAYGLAEFTDMRAVFPGVDAGMLDRTRAWLLDRRDGQGGWKMDERALDSFGRASKPVTDAYIAWSLVQSGATLDVEIDAQARLAETTDDPYLLALATGTLQAARPSAARSAAARLAARQAADGAWTGADHSITRSGGRNLDIETTALAVRALVTDGGHAGAVEAGVRWLLAQRDASGRWGSTQGTVLTLDALTRYAERAPARAPGSAVVKVDGAAVGTLSWSAEGGLATVALPLGEGRHTVTLEPDGAAVPYTVGATWSTRTPASDPATAVSLTTSLADAELDPGDTVRLVATLRNTRGEGLPTVIARVGIPAGLEVQTWQLEELRHTRRVDFYETREDEVILYWREMAPGAVREVPIDLLATVPGEYTAPASRAYLYYDDDAKVWAAPVRARVSGG